MKSFLKSAFTDHPESVGETYFEHLFTALNFSTRLLVASMACFLHAVFPFACKKTGSEAIRCLHKRMVEHRRKSCSANTSESDANSL